MYFNFCFLVVHHFVCVTCYRTIQSFLISSFYTELGDSVLIFFDRPFVTNWRSLILGNESVKRLLVSVLSTILCMSVVQILSYICTRTHTITNTNFITLIILSLKTQQRFLVFGTCFDVSNIIISHYEYIGKIYKMVLLTNQLKVIVVTLEQPDRTLPNVKHPTATSITYFTPVIIIPTLEGKFHPL